MHIQLMRPLGQTLGPRPLGQTTRVMLGLGHQQNKNAGGTHSVWIDLVDQSISGGFGSGSGLGSARSYGDVATDASDSIASPISGVSSSADSAAAESVSSWQSGGCSSAESSSGCSCGLGGAESATSTSMGLRCNGNGLSSLLMTQLSV